ncbi:MAG: hypothetical protein ABMA01_20410 [Chthoniobacteraceae bacterium]
MRCLFFLLLCGSLIAQESTERQALEKRLRSFWDMGGRKLAAQSWKWPKEERAMLAKEFRSYWESGKWGKPYDEEAYGILLLLGDREATRHCVQKMVKDKFPALGYSGSPIVIEYLMPHVFKLEAYSRTWVSDVVHVPFSFIATSDVFKILAESSAFSDEVRNWAKSTKVSDSLSERAELRRWWNENKVHFAKDDYKAVKPGLPIPSAFEEEKERRRGADSPPWEEERNEIRRKHGLPPTEETKPK